MVELQSIDWRLFLCGISYKTSSLEEREPLQINGEQIAAAHALFASLPGVLESTIVSTCNRIEFYFVGEIKYDPFQVVQSFYRRFRELDVSELKPHFYIHSNQEAAAHLFHVAAGIDSMVLGENQVVGQLRDAYSSACAVKAAGKIIHRLFHQAFRAGKLVRTNTEMGKGACSVSSAAVDLLKTRIDGLDKPNVLFVGINQMITLAAKNLHRLNCGDFFFANRTRTKAIEFASEYKSTGHSLHEIPELLGKTDILFSCTSSDTPVLGTDVFHSYLRANPNSKLLVMDMAIPRDIAIDDAYSDRIEVHDLASIEQFVKDQQQKREDAIPQAEEIIERKLAEFSYWFEHVIREPVYNGLKDSFELVRTQELVEILKKLPPEMRKEVDGATRQMVNRLLKLKIRESTDS